ncbi:MAG: glycogen/starch/alpha-glucan phosphorylase [Oscillospiraceae bacterium]
MSNDRKNTTVSLEDELCEKLRLAFGSTVEEATDAQMLRACALVLRDKMAERAMNTRQTVKREQKRQVHYLSMEFLMGRSLMKNAYNLGILPQLREALEQLGFRAADIFELEPDAGLGNGGLGRLAACYLDSMTTLEIPATGYSICYELGIFRQKIVEGQQVELPDNWKDLGGAWLLPKPQETEEIHFGGHIREFWRDGHHHIVHEDYTTVLAIPCDMEIAGYQTQQVNSLRLWDAKSPVPMDMSLFSRGEYLKATEQHAMAEVIAKVLYPEDNHIEGKSLRLKQQYFFVSATVQSVVRHHLETYGTLRNFHEKNVFQINDTHPALVIPELMRILIDDAGLAWDEAWFITTHSVAYTNHTVLIEALERWPQFLIEQLLPRIWQILVEISNRWQTRVEDFYHDAGKTQTMAIIWEGQVRMANLCVAGGMAVNGVSALHSDILRHEVFRDACNMEPEKFQNVTNGIDHRRWLAECNPGLHGLICDLTGGDGYLLHPTELEKLETFAGDSAVLERLAAIKRQNKLDFAAYVQKTKGVLLNPDAIFDVQVKRLHEYKRQLLNALHIIALYQRLQDDPNAILCPQTFLFGAKAAPGYAVAKRIIRLINSLADQINSDPICKGKLQVVFLENYQVSLAERLMPASEVSQQISTAGKEASGTGNMKFMMNGALTVGTLDGANVEMHQVLGDENMFLFGLHADQVAQLNREGYVPHRFYDRDPVLRRALDGLKAGFRDGVRYDDLYARLLGNPGGASDEYLLLADFAAYCAAERRMTETYADPRLWNQMSLRNIARSGIFAADRSVAEYAANIWKVPVKERD